MAKPAGVLEPPPFSTFVPYLCESTFNTVVLAFDAVGINVVELNR